MPRSIHYLCPLNLHEESLALFDMSNYLEPTNSHGPSITPTDHVAPIEFNSEEELTLHFQEYEDPDTSDFSPSIPHPFSNNQGIQEPMPPYIPSDPQVTVDETVSPLQTLDPFFEPYIPSSPPNYYPPLFVCWEDGLSLRINHFDYPEFSVRRWNDMPVEYGLSERYTEMQGITGSQPHLETNGELKLPQESIAIESLIEKKEKSDSAANFECNICLNMAHEPVVTSCGHLFCWTCLYQWLCPCNVYNECPVCKGSITESNITPIYGRGSSKSSHRKWFTEDGDVQNTEESKIPPRPSGNRFESSRQQHWPISGRNGEGISASWMGFGRPTREHMNAEFGTESERFRANTEHNLSGYTSQLLGDGFDLWSQPEDNMMIHQSSGIDRFLPDQDESLGEYSMHEASMSSVNGPNPEEPVHRENVMLASNSDQVSISSTFAVILGEIGPADNYSAGSPRSRSRERSGSLGSSGSSEARRRN